MWFLRDCNDLTRTVHYPVPRYLNCFQIDLEISTTEPKLGITYIALEKPQPWITQLWQYYWKLANKVKIKNNNTKQTGKGEKC